MSCSFCIAENRPVNFVYDKNDTIIDTILGEATLILCEKDTVLTVSGVELCEEHAVIQVHES